MFDLSFFSGKRVLVTGHTGFKGAWLCRMLTCHGAEVTGYALEPSMPFALFSLAGLQGDMHSVLGDVRDLDHLQKTFDEAKPELVIHLAAQPIVRESFHNPVYTYHTNVMGTVNVLECVRRSNTVCSFLNVTTDKVYKNKEWEWGYRENEELDGFDPYSNSKSCSELVTHSYERCFFSDHEGTFRLPVSTARAGNVIGGGDFANDRIIPDCVRAAAAGRDIVVRNPHSIRPYQHVLEPIYAYLMILAGQEEDISLAGSYNVGPDEKDCLQTGELVDKFVQRWGSGIQWLDQSDGGPHEADYLKLDCSKMKTRFGWKPRWDIDKAISATVEWSKRWLSGEDVRICMDGQIQGFLDS